MTYSIPIQGRLAILYLAGNLSEVYVNIMIRIWVKS